jgi:hypothetical protein
MSRDAVLIHRAALARIDRRHRAAVALLADAHRQWWRPVANFRRRRFARAFLAANDKDFAEVRVAWGNMSPSERAASTASALRGAAIQSSSLPSSGGTSGS